MLGRRLRTVSVRFALPGRPLRHQRHDVLYVLDCYRVPLISASSAPGLPQQLRPLPRRRISASTPVEPVTDLRDDGRPSRRPHGGSTELRGPELRWNGCYAPAELYFVLSTARNRGSPRAMPARHRPLSDITGALGARGVVLIAADETGRRGALGGRERTVDDGANAVISNRACSSMIEAFVSSSGIAAPLCERACA